MPLLWNLFWSTSAAHPLEWTGPLGSRFEVSQWGVGDGLPQSSVTDIAQSPEGYLYVSTFGGLARFDGVRFLVFDPTRSPDLPSIRFTAVAAATDGRVWVGLQYGRVAELLGDRILLLPDLGDPPVGAIRAIYPLGNDLWIAGPTTLARYHEGSWTRHDWPTNSIVGDGSGIWAGGDIGLARVDAGGVPTPVPTLLPPPVAGLHLAAGTLWIASDTGVEARVGDESRVVYRVAEGGPRMGGGVPVIDRDGQLWIGDTGGLALLGDAADLLAHPKPARTPLARLTLTDGVRVTTVDREGHLWAGTDLDGLLRISPLPFTRHEVSEASHQSLLSIDATADPVLVAPVCSGLWAQGDQGFAKVPLDGVPSPCVGAVLRLRSGEVLFGAGPDFYRLGDPPESITRFPADVTSIAESRDGTVWVGTDGAGAYTVRHGIVANVSGVYGVIAVIVEAPDGAIWLGTGSEVVVVRPDGTTDRLDEDQGLSQAQIRAIRVEPDGTAWLGTYGGGLVRLAGGKATTYTDATGLPEDVVSTILADGRGYLWTNGNRGVCRMEIAELEDVAAGRSSSVRALLFPTGEGNGGNWPSATIDPNGDLWFSTISGAVVFDPDQIFSNEVAPIAIIEEISVDGRSYPVGGGWEAPPGPRELTVRFTTAVLGRPELARFRYRLTPGDLEWRDAEDQRLIRYAQLAPGTYRFEVQAANEDGVLSEPASTRIVLQPKFIETNLFRIGVGVAAIGGVLGAFQLRTMAQRSRNAQLQDEIGQRKRVESALRISEAHYRSMFEAASDGLLIVDPDGMVRDANPAAIRLFGQPEEVLRGRQRETLVETGPDGQRGIPADGPSFPARVTTVPLGDGRELTSVVDLSQLVELQGRLANAQRLEAVGRLAGGVAHDFNNLLTVVRANAVSLRTSIRGTTPETTPVLESIDQIEAVARRGSDLTRQLLAFGQRQLLRPELVDASALVVGLEPIIRRLLRPDLVLAVHAPEPGVVLADPTQTELALVNLVLNAIDAIDGPGGIDLAVRRVADTDAQHLWPTLPPGNDWVVLSVSDTGAGIAPEVLSHLFEPFFTTKGGQGNGLGLASVHGFVTQSAGFVFARSVARQGATFDIVLPAAAGKPRTRAPESIPPRDPSVAASILVCDDDPLVRRTLERLLRSGGFQVRGADDGLSALALLRETPADLLVTDVLMPGMTGIELATHARVVQPGLRVVFVSGYTSEVLATELDGPLVAKPFEPQALLEIVRKNLR